MRDDESDKLWRVAIRENLPPVDTQEALDHLGAEIRRTGPTPCKGRSAEYQDYDPEHPPPDEWVEQACVGCKVTGACLAYGLLAKRDSKRRDLELVGIYGGQKIEGVKI